MEGDGSGIQTTGYYLERIQSDLHNALPKIELQAPQITMGRGIGNNIIWESLQISRRHCVMEYRHPTWMIKDTSTNGMLINSERMEKDKFITLHENDIISFVPTGSLQYRFVKASSPRKYGSPNVGLHPSLVQPAPALASIAEESVVELTPNGGIAKSPKRKTGSGQVEHVNPEKKRKCLQVSPSAVNISRLEGAEEDDELLDIDEVPSFFIPHTKPPTFFENDNKLEQELMEAVALKGLSEEEVSRVKNQFRNYEERIRHLEEEKRLIVQEQRLELIKVQNQLKSAQSENRVFQEELFKKIMEGLETEFSCCICNEIFIQATVIDCGHTFCSHCLTEWMKRKPECPTCRKQVRIQVKHIEMENFITKIHTILSEEIQQKRRIIISERKEQEVKAAASAAAAARPQQPRPRRHEPMLDAVAEFLGMGMHDLLPNAARGPIPMPPAPGMAHGGPPDHQHPHARHFQHHHFPPFIHPYYESIRNQQPPSGPSTRRRSVRIPPPRERQNARGPGPVRGRGAHQVPDMPPLDFNNLGPGHMDILTVD